MPVLTVSCAVYNFDGSEILATYSDEDVYIFNNHPPHDERDQEYLKRFQGHRNNQTGSSYSANDANTLHRVAGTCVKMSLLQRFKLCYPKIMRLHPKHHLEVCPQWRSIVYVNVYNPGIWILELPYLIDELTWVSNSDTYWSAQSCKLLLIELWYKQNIIRDSEISQMYPILSQKRQLFRSPERVRRFGLWLRPYFRLGQENNPYRELFARRRRRWVARVSVATMQNEVR